MEFDVKEVVTRSEDSGATGKVFKAFTLKNLTTPIITFLSYLVMIAIAVYGFNIISTLWFSYTIRYDIVGIPELVFKAYIWALLMTTFCHACAWIIDTSPRVIIERFGGDKRVESKDNQSFAGEPRSLDKIRNSKERRVGHKSIFTGRVAKIFFWASLLVISYKTAVMMSSVGYSFLSINTVWFAVMTEDGSVLVDHFANTLLWMFLLRTISEWFLSGSSRALTDSKEQNVVQARNTAENRILHKSSPRVRMFLGLTVVFITAATGYSFILLGKSV